MKIPRNLSGKELIKVLIPLHNPLKLGTLAGILNDASAQLNIPKEEILKQQ